MRAFSNLLPSLLRSPRRNSLRFTLSPSISGNPRFSSSSLRRPPEEKIAEVTVFAQSSPDTPLMLRDSGKVGECLSLPSLDSKVSRLSAPNSVSFDLSPTVTELRREEVSKINLLIPRLCKLGRFREAVALLDTAILAGVSLQSLPVAAVLGELDMDSSMALLTALLHNPRRSSETLTAVCGMMIENHLYNGRVKCALKVFDFMRRPNSLCTIEADLCGKMVRGLCRHGRLVEAMKVVREMLSEFGGVEDVRESVYMALLHDARVREGMEVDEVLKKVSNGDEESCGRAVMVIDRILMNWRD